MGRKMKDTIFLDWSDVFILTTTKFNHILLMLYIFNRSSNDLISLFSLSIRQRSQAGREHPVVHRPVGFPEAHRLLAQVALRWWPSWSRQEEEHEEGPGWQRWCWWGGRRLSHSLFDVQIKHRFGMSRPFCHCLVWQTRLPATTAEAGCSVGVFIRIRKNLK